MMAHQVKRAPLGLRARMGDFDYAGVVCVFGDDWRLSVNLKADGYTLQQRVNASAWATAGARSPKTLAGIAEKFGHMVPNLLRACEVLPDDPAAALPDFTAAVADLDKRVAAILVGSGAYAGVVAVADRLRLVVRPCRKEYGLQWLHPVMGWQSLFVGSSLSAVASFYSERIFRGQHSRRRLPETVAARLETFKELFGHLPDDPSLNELPLLPVIE